MTTIWAPTCWVRLGFRVADDAPQLTTADVPPPKLGIESFDDDAGFSGIGHDIVPYNCTVVRNNYTTADTAKVQIPLSKLPIDPRVVDQIQVQVFGGVLSREEVLNRARLGGAGLDRGLVIGPDIDPVTGKSNELFRGFCQTHMVKKGKDFDYVELSCVDLTAIFTSAEMYEDPLNGIPKTARIDEVIQLLIYGDGVPVKDASRRFGLPGARGTVIVNETGADLPTLADIHPPEAFDSKGGARKSRSAGSSKKLKFWDLITDLCKSAGLWCKVRAGRIAVNGTVPGAELVIMTPLTFNAARGAQLSGDPGIRQFIDGHNIDEYTIEKHYTGEQMPTAIEVRSYDPTIRKTRFARYPKRRLVNRKTTTGKGDREEIKVMVVSPLSGPSAMQTLSQMAVSLYEHQARQGLEVTVSSDTTLSALLAEPSMFPNGQMNSEVADMFHLLPGEPFEMGAQPPDLIHNLASSRLIFANLTYQRRLEEYLIAGFSPLMASKVATQDESSFLTRFFRTVRVTWNWSYSDTGGGEEGGWGWEVQGKGYQDSRHAPDALTELCETGVGRA